MTSTQTVKKKAPAAAPAAAKRPGAKAPPQSEPAPAPEVSEMIRMAAYFRAERRGFAAGNDLQDWFEAEHEVLRTLA